MIKTIAAITLTMTLALLGTPSFARSTFDYQHEDSTRVMRCYIPADLERVRGILLCGNGAGGDSRADTKDQHKRLFAEKHGLAVIATGKFGRFKNGVKGKDYAAFQLGLLAIAKQSGHPELTRAPMLLWGFSNGGQMAYALARLHPERVIAFIVNKGGYYITDEDGGQEPTSTPAIFFSGENDAGKNGRHKVIHALYRKGRDQGAAWCWIEERNARHERGNSEPLAFALFDAILAIRYPHPMGIPEEGTPTLRSISMEKGWLVEEGHVAWQTGWVGISPYDDVPQKKRKQYGWVPTELLAKLYRSSASYDPAIKPSFSQWQKAIKITSPYNPAGRIGRTNGAIPADTPVEIKLEIAPQFKDWQEVALYVNGKQVANQPNARTNKISFLLRIEETTPLTMVYAAVQLGGKKNASRSSHVLLLTSNAGDN